MAFGPDGISVRRSDNHRINHAAPSPTATSESMAAAARRLGASAASCQGAGGGISSLGWWCERVASIISGGGAV
jgi:hypothetical protein